MRVIMNMDRETIEDSNKILKEKTEEIWNLFERSNPMFKIHLCSNYENGLQEQEKSRLERILGGYSNIEIIEHVNSDYVKLINDNIDQMYVDKLNGKITEAMYERLYKKLIDEAKQKEREYIEIQEMQNTSKQDDSENIKKLVKEFLELKELTPEVMKVIINRIEIHQDKQVDLYFNFKQLNNITQNCLL